MTKRGYDILLTVLIFSAIVVTILFAFSLFNYFSDSASGSATSAYAAHRARPMGKNSSVRKDGGWHFC